MTRDMRGAHRARSDRAGQRKRRTRRVGITVLVIALVVGGLLGGVALKLNSNITRLDIAKSLGQRPVKASGPTSPLNILVIGSDTRQGIGTTEYGTDTVEGGAHSDTNLLVHIAADRTSAFVVSIPRDSMTKAPKDCADPASTVAQGEVRQWNYNFNKGGPGCTVKTLEGLTGVFVDHVVVVDFAGFQSMVDGLGGVEVCLPSAVEDKDAHLSLPAGRQRIDGKEALGYVRARKSIGDGSDLGRIKRQQLFMSSMAQEATKTSLLLRPDRLYSFLDAATRSMTADADLSVGVMREIAGSLKGLGIDQLRFVTVPTEPYRADPNRVQWKQAEADELWRLVREDKPLPGRDQEEASQPLTVSPEDITVSVVNDTPAEGLASQEVEALSVQGFSATVGTAGPTGAVDGVQVRYAKGDREAARTVAAAYPGARLVTDPGAGEQIKLVLGTGSPHAKAVDNRTGTAKIPAPTVTAPPRSGDLGSVSASQDICG